MRAVQVICAAVLLLLAGVMLWFHVTGALRWPVMAALGAFSLWLALRWWSRRPVGRWLLAVLGAFALWFALLIPRNDRDWWPEVSRGVTATVTGDNATLHDIRAFEWTSPTAFTPAWTDQTFALQDLASVDIYTSDWGLPGIAHTLIGFGFADGRHVVFSAEIRKETGEDYSAIAGFFRRYELVLIAAEERDIIRLRTDLRREAVSLWPLITTPDQRQAMFLSLLDLGNDLAENPRWYNTLTANCTTVLWQLGKATDGRLPFDWRVLASGHLPDYLREVGLVDPALTDAQALLPPTDGVQATGAAYSRVLRQGRP